MTPRRPKTPMAMGFDEEQTAYDSSSQQARVWTEKWTGRWIYCLNCKNDQVEKFENNKPAADFYCAACNEQYEVKSTKGKFGTKVVNGAFKTLSERLASDTNPNFAFLSYSASKREVRELFFVPKQFMSIEKIEKRKPLASTARRAGWVGCNILLGKVPSSGKIYVVRDGISQSSDLVRNQWQKTLFLRQTPIEARGWMVDVMRCCEGIGRAEFEINDIYAFEGKLGEIYPGNKHVKEKIRQQLQLLRDNQYLDFVGRGRYRLR